MIYRVYCHGWFAGAPYVISFDYPNLHDGQQAYNAHIWEVDPDGHIYWKVTFTYVLGEMTHD